MQHYRHLLGFMLGKKCGDKPRTTFLIPQTYTPLKEISFLVWGGGEFFNDINSR